MTAEVTAVSDRRHSRPPALPETIHAVDELLATRVGEVRRVLTDAGCGLTHQNPQLTVDLATELQQRLGDPSKRLRPALAHRGWELAGGDRRTWPELVRVAAAMDLLHLFGLVHDDVMDRSETRRGRVTLQVDSSRRHHAAGASGDSDHFGDSVAVLLGDLALSEADALVGDCSTAIRHVWRVMSVELVQGQLLDVTHAADPNRDAATSRLIARLKSGRYTVTRPLQLGALVAGGEQDHVDRLIAWGDLVGDAFALRDDVLGVWGDPAVTGKPADDDLLEGKPTILLVWAGELLDDQSRSLLEACRVGRLNPEGVRRLRRAMERAGVRRRAEQELRTLTARARAMIPGLTADGRFAEELRVLIDAVAWRAA